MLSSDVKLFINLIDAFEKIRVARTMPPEALGVKR